MGRYTGPKVKLSRRVGAPIADTPKHTAKELNLPGVHGYRGRRNTEYGVRLIEKQKLRFHYGMLEKQFRKFLDIAKSIWAARQIVAHGHVMVDGHKTDIASFRVEVGQTITFKEGIHKVL